MSIQKTFFDKFHFNERFLRDHAGKIVTDPKIAIIELIANAYDAGAKTIKIVWPDDLDGVMSVTDDGTGLSEKEFDYRWHYFNYNRIEEQGSKVQFPPGVKGIRRTAFGQSGKGRFAPFCFAKEYSVTSRKGGEFFQANIRLTEGGDVPFSISKNGTGREEGYGTTISAAITQASGLLPVDEVRNLVGSKFLVDPSISVFVNGEPVQLLDLSGVASEPFPVDPHGNVTVHFVDAQKHSRVAKLNGIAWWVNRKMVGEPNWNRLGNDGVYLDKRKGPGRRYSFIVEADFLKSDVNSSWTGFHASQKVGEVETAVHDFIAKRLSDSMADERRNRKRGALKASREAIGVLPNISKAVVTQFVDQV